MLEVKLCPSILINYKLSYPDRLSKGSNLILFLEKMERTIEKARDEGLRIVLIVLTKCRAPPSSRSSLATEVTTTCLAVVQILL